MTAHPLRKQQPADVVDRLHGGLVVSCQVARDHPLHGPSSIAALARCAELGGAAAVRVDGSDDVRAVARAVAIPVLGIRKVGGETRRPVITPAYEDCVELVAAGAEIVAVELTREHGTHASDFAHICARVHDELGAAVMADVSTLEEGLTAWQAGADLVATTLAGYTPESSPGDGPDLPLAQALAVHGVRTVLEGRVQRPEDVTAAFAAGAWAVVVGKAITAPDAITARFADGIPSTCAVPDPDDD